MDPLTFLQKAAGRIVGRHWFAFRQEIYDREGKRPDPLRDRQEAWGMRLSTRLFSRRYPGIPGRVHIHDSMLQNDGPEELAHYLSVGRSAIANIEAALAAAGRSWESIDACLDMACGYGRVMRHLAARLGGARIVACEVMPEAIRFCAEEFGARPLLSELDPERTGFPGRYDLIWVGSLLTHLVPERGIAFAARLADHLRPGGVLVFSFQGPSCLAQIPAYGFMFENRAGEFERQMREAGAAYLPYYDHTPEYGIALFAPERIRDGLKELRPGRLRPVLYAERGWDDHQDVIAFQREPWSGWQAAV
jgi:SAM-dependent methyltransferase